MHESVPASWITDEETGGQWFESKSTDPSTCSAIATTVDRGYYTLLDDPRRFGDYDNKVDGRRPSIGPSCDVEHKEYHHGGPQAASSAAPAVAITTAAGHQPTDTRTATRVHQSVTLPAMAPGVLTRLQAAEWHEELC
ncbi:hypothetical protein HPB47_003139 [Ixodes persulcatus]|uniref:Uncharacterized protein n=1 Tax=Ixodes persulcatus TaxID=34615 RepID=A0AC60PKA0_IXOPE|nr:hypothetical protein HPB47_003139 [Ixodes persulcatus]